LLGPDRQVAEAAQDLAEAIGRADQLHIDD
jgi:hypothetical protein